MNVNKIRNASPIEYTICRIVGEFNNVYVIISSFNSYTSRFRVRLGEHDFSTTADGQHQDIRIALAEPHEHHDDTLKLNDIAILHLYYDVKFDGKLKFGGELHQNQN